MLFRTNSFFLKRACILLCGIMLYSCVDSRKTAPGGHDMPERSKLPDNHILNLGEDVPTDDLSTSVFPFATTAITLDIEGTHHPFITVALPDAAADEKALALMEQYRPLATSFIKQWASTQTGILIDLRSMGHNFRTVDFIINTSGKSFPVVFILDDAATERMNAYTSLLRQIPGLQATVTRFTSDSTLQLLPASKLTERSTLQELPVKHCFR